MNSPSQKSLVLKNKTQDEVMRNWTGGMNQPVVSICCITYNHQEFIGDALEGFLMQITTFPFEIIVYDDCSTDETQNIIKQYQNRYPDIIKPLLQEENQYSKGRNIMPLFVFPKARGKYIATCEGDDYWTDHLKLEKQVALMEVHKEINFSFHKVFVINRDAEVLQIIGNYGHRTSIVKTEDIIERKHGFIGASSYMIRANTLENIINFFKKYGPFPVGDIYITILASFSNGGLFINENMSVYRKFSIEHSWSEQNKNPKQRINTLKKYLESFPILDQYTAYQFTKTIDLLHDKYFKELLFLENKETYFKKIDNLIKKLQQKDEKYILYGAGTLGKYIFNRLSNQIEYVVDREVRSIEGTEVFPLSHLRHSNKKIIITPFQYNDSIVEELRLDYSIQESNIISLSIFL